MQNLTPKVPTYRSCLQTKLPSGEGRLRSTNFQRQLRPRQRQIRMQSEGGRLRRQFTFAELHADGPDRTATADSDARHPRHRHRREDPGSDVFEYRRISRSGRALV